MGERKSGDAVEGYVKLWRKSLDSAVFKNANLWMFWTWCLMKATRKPYTAMVGYQKIELLPGQFLFGRKKATEELPLSEKNVRTCTKTLEKLGNLAIKTANKFSVITICNWDTYQSQETGSGQQNGQQTASKRPANGHIQEVLEVEEEKKNKHTQSVSGKPKRDYASEAKEVLQYFNDKAGKKCRDVTPILQRLEDGGTVEQCRHIIDVKEHDPYFRKNPSLFAIDTLFRKSHWDKYLNQQISDFKPVADTPPPKIRDSPYICKGCNQGIYYCTCGDEMICPDCGKHKQECNCDVGKE